MTNRILIDKRAGILELEGDKTLVEQQLEKLLPLIGSPGFGTAPRDERDPGSADDTAPCGSDEGSTTNKRTRRGGANRPPKGQSCADRMMVLREDGYFNEHRTTGQIVSELAAKGWTHNTKQVSAAGVRMFKRNDIQRTKSGTRFKYYWDRD